MSTPVLFKLEAEDKKLSLEKLVEAASPNAEFFLLVVLSTIIVTLGLLMDNAPVVIGGMLVAPILSPILSIAMGIVMADWMLLKQSAKITLITMTIILGISMLISILTPTIDLTREIEARTSLSIMLLLVAIAAGIAAAFAFARKSMSETLPGIAISVALLPPLVVFPIGLALGDYGIAVRGILSFLLNALGIIVAATIIFSLMGFYTLRKRAEQKLEHEIGEKANNERK